MYRTVCSCSKTHSQCISVHLFGGCSHLTHLLDRVLMGSREQNQSSISPKLKCQQRNPVFWRGNHPEILDIHSIISLEVRFLPKHHRFSSMFGSSKWQLRSNMTWTSKPTPSILKVSRWPWSICSTKAWSWAYWQESPNFCGNSSTLVHYL